MSGTLGPRLVLVTRETEYDELLVRHATPGQAGAFLRRRGQSLEGLDTQRRHLGDILAEIRAGVPKGWRIAAVRRAELDRFLFAPEDVVVAVGQDGLVANLAKYLHDQPVIGVNADPARNAGVLVPHAPGDVAAMLPAAAAGTLPTVARTMIRAELDDGQSLLALNEIFVGHASHQSARYTIKRGAQAELHSSSGLIVASGTGATGWALSIERATGVQIDIAPEEPAGLFLVREPWPSPATGTEIVSGRLELGDTLLLASRMNEGGVVFADGMEHDRLDFAWGRTLTVSVAADRRLRFVPGRGTPVRAAAAVRVAGRRAVPRPSPVPAAPAPAAPAQPATKAAPVRLVVPQSPKKGTAVNAAKERMARFVYPRLKRVFRLICLLALIAVLVRACGGPEQDRGPAVLSPSLMDPATPQPGG